MRTLRRFPQVLVFVLGISVLLPAQVRPGKTVTDIRTHIYQTSALPKQVPSTAPAKRPTISPAAYDQIKALLQEKKSRTSLQKKISSQLLFASRMILGQPVANGVPYLRTGVEVDDYNNLYVDITAKVTPNLLAQLRSTGVRVISSRPAYNNIRGFIPPNSLETVASMAGVVFISPRRQATTWQSSTPLAPGIPRISPGFGRRAATVRQKLARVIANGTGQGSATSEGDATHRAAEARGTFGVSGSGLKIGVLSDGVTSLADSQASGDLGPVTVMPGQTGQGDEGTAMLEIIHDLAPGADLYFATAFNGIDSFAQNIRDLRTAGCDIIVDDVFYFVETPFQDGQAPSVVSTTNGGVVIQAVNDVTASGALYFSSSGNSGNLGDGTSGTYEGDYVPVAPPAPLVGDYDSVAQFGTSGYDTITQYGGPITLYWADPLGGSGNDYDLFVLDSTGSTVLDASTDVQDGTQDPFEIVGDTNNNPGNLIVVAKYSGADVFFHLDTNRGGLDVATAGQTHGHAAAAAAYGVAATPAYLAIAPGYPTGPYPNPFSASNVIEPYSSDGPRQLFFMADGTPITPGNFTSTGGTIRQKPDITAADGVSVTGAGGFSNPFYGTSAAAPHAGAIAALVKSAKAGITNPEINTALTSTAIDIMSSGVDRDSGAGIIMAFEAIQSLGVVGGANLEMSNFIPAENPGNGDGAIEAGEGASLMIELKNTSGVTNATGIMATLTSSTPGIIITQPGTSAYPDLAAGTGIGSNVSPFTFTVASETPCGLTAQFTLTLNYTGGPSPTVLNFSVPTGPPPATFDTTLDLTLPDPLPGITTATGSQTGRIFRDGNASVCGTPKTFPGVYDPSGGRQYDSYTFTACRDTCALVDLTSTNQYALFSAMYSPSYNPGDTSANYAGDAGSSGTLTEYGVSTTTGNTYTVVVHELNPGGGSGTAYKLQLSSCAFNCTTPNQLPVALVKDVTVAAGPDGTASAAINDGSYDPEGGALTLTQTPAGPYSVGTTSVMLTVVDDKGATAQASANVTVTPDFALPTTLSNMTVKAGSSVNQTITVTPYGPFNAAITFACSGLPSGANCSFAPSSITPGSTPSDVVLTITTTAPHLAALPRSQTAAIYALWLPFVGFGVIGVVLMGNRKRGGKALLALAVILLLPLVLPITSCDNGGQHLTGGTPVGTYTITVTATSGATVHSSNLTLTVQQE